MPLFPTSQTGVTDFPTTASPTVITYAPSIAPSGGDQTEFPTTSSPTTAGQTESPTTLDQTGSPTILGTISSAPSVIGELATDAPTLSIGTESPTIPDQTEMPTTDPPTVPGSPLYFAGAAEAVGDDQDVDIVTPTLVEDATVIDVSAGSRYSIVVLEDGTAQSAGYIEAEAGYTGHLGVPGTSVVEGVNAFQDIAVVYNEVDDEVTNAPPFTMAFAGAESETSTGSIHSLLIVKDGNAWLFGSNAKGQLCLGDFDDRLIPQRIPLDQPVISAAIGNEHTILLLEDGTIYGCGSNEAGQLGLGDGVVAVDAPRQIEDVTDVVQVSAGHGSSYIKSTGGLYVTGSNLYGQLCIDTGGASVLTPALLDDVNVEIVASIEGIKSSAYILFNDGSVGACGRNNYGQLGDGSNEDRVRTVIAPLPDEVGIEVLGVGPSSDSIFFVNQNGDTYATGLNDNGQLGVGDADDRNSLTLVLLEIDDRPVKVSASDSHTMFR